MNHWRSKDIDGSTDVAGFLYSCLFLAVSVTIIPIYLPTVPISLSLSIYLPTYPSIRPSVRPSISQSINPSIHPSIHPSINQSINHSIILSFCHSELPKMVRARCASCILGSQCANFQKVVRSGPDLVCFVHFESF